MSIEDLYRLEKSDTFNLTPRQEITVNLSLKKVPPKPCTLLLGSVGGKCGQIENATVKIYDKSFNPISYTATNEKGCFAFENVLIEGEYFVIATAENYALSEVCRVLIYSHIPTSISIWLNDKQTDIDTAVYGIVFDHANKKLPNADIIILKENNQEQCVATTQTNLDGEYFICSLKTGKYQIKASKKGYIFPQIISFELYPKEFSLVNLFLYPDPSFNDSAFYGISDFYQNSLQNNRSRSIKAKRKLPVTPTN